MGGVAVVPNDVVRVKIDPSVRVIPYRAFYQRRQLQEVELHNGLHEIGYDAFSMCKALREVHVSDGVESIGCHAFYHCNFTKFRSPPLVTTIPHGMLQYNKRLFSVEVPEIIIQVEFNAFVKCFSLRNVALASNTAVEWCAFLNCSDLLHIFDTLEAIIDALRNRFAGLPVHSKMYYISYYNQMTAEDIRNLIKIGQNGELDPSGLQQDCLGMTPLQILACSTVQRLELYQLIVDKYPANLIVEDAWGAIPLMYAIWGDAPSEIVEFLVNSYQSLYPDHEFDWNDMVITLGRADASEDVIRNLLEVQQTLYPGYTINWELILGVLAEPTLLNLPHALSAIFCFLIRCSIAVRVSAIGVKHFRDVMADIWMGHEFNRQAWYTETITKLEYYESEYQRLKESTSLLEFALWKIMMNDSSFIHGNVINRCNKKLKMDTSEFKLQCRISCGADYVIQNVWPYLLPSDFVRSYVPDER